MNLITSIFRILLLFCVGLGLFSCKSVSLFSFKGTNVPPEAQTLSIQNFSDESGNGPPNLSITFNEKMREYFIRNTRLAMVQNNGDLQFEGSIVGYTVTPIAPVGDQQMGSALQRLTISVKAQYNNNFDEEANFDNEFSFYLDFPADKNITDVENELIPAILDQIVLDIFNKSLGNW